MTKEELIKEIEEKEKYLNELKYKFSILSMEPEALWVFIKVKDEKIKKLQDKLKRIEDLLKEDNKE